MTSFSTREKADLRREKIAARDALTEGERLERSEAIVERILGTEAFRKAATVMLYRSVAGEVMLDGLPERAPDKRYVYPRCLKDRRMSALWPWDGEAWRPGPFGIPEPDPERSGEVDPGDIDLILCPCTAFDAALGRLGMGGGYYDRFLPRCRRAAVWAAAFEVQRTSHVPMTPEDRRMDAVVTERELVVGGQA